MSEEPRPREQDPPLAIELQADREVDPVRLATLLALILPDASPNAMDAA